MYLVSIYFDEKSDKRIRQWMKQVALRTGNDFMIKGDVPPHITISALEAREEEKMIRCLEAAVKQMKAGNLTWVSVGVFFPGVIYTAPVLNKYLQNLAEVVHDSVSGMEEISVSRYYRPMQWVPHTTIGKKLSKEEMQIAFEVLQRSFGVFEGTVTKIGLARTNPYEDLVVWELQADDS